jgi:hypothetical protein
MPLRKTSRNRGRVSNDALRAHIEAIHGHLKGEYGWQRMCKELLERGVNFGKERVRKQMTQHDSPRYKNDMRATWAYCLEGACIMRRSRLSPIEKPLIAERCFQPTICFTTSKTH